MGAMGHFGPPKEGGIFWARSRFAPHSQKRGGQILGATVWRKKKNSENWRLFQNGRKIH